MYWFTLLLIVAAAHGKPTDQGDLMYQFKYFIKDDTTGDFKTQEETRTGDTVQGRYSVAEPNGDLRVVTYTADEQKGFHAHVQVHPGASPMNTVEKEDRKEMEVLPRYIQRTGFSPQRPIKADLIEEDKHVDEVQESTNFNPDQSVEESKPQEVVTQEPTMPPTTIAPLIETPRPDPQPPTQIICHMNCIRKTLEANPKLHKGTQNLLNDDKVQVEMERIIRAEMEEPASYKMGSIPLPFSPRPQRFRPISRIENLNYYDTPEIRGNPGNVGYVALPPSSYSSLTKRLQTEDYSRPLMFTLARPFLETRSEQNHNPFQKVPFLRHQAPFHSGFTPGIAIIMIPSNHFQQND